MALEWQLQSAHFIQHDSKGPDIGLNRVILILAYLRRHVIRRTNNSLVLLQSLRQALGNAKVPQLDKPFLGHKNILAFQISMDDLPVMDVLDC